MKKYLLIPKTSLFLLLLILCISKAQAQLEPIYDSIYVYERDSTTKWTPVTKSVDFIYNLNKDVISYVKKTKEKDSQTWKNFGKFSYVYDANNRKTNFYYQSWDQNKWVDDARMTYIYTGNQITTTEERFSSNTSTWRYALRTIYTYDSNGREIVRESQSLNSNQWVSNWRYVTTYTLSNKIKKIDREAYINSNWVQETREIYEFDTNDNITEYQHIETDYLHNWMNHIKGVYTYSNNKLDIIQFYKWDLKSSVWELSDKHTSFDWDTNNNLIYYKLVTLDPSGNYVPSSNYSAKYNIYNQLTDKKTTGNVLLNFSFPEDSTHYYISESSNSIISEKTNIGSIENYPNPFNEHTNIHYVLANNSTIQINICDLLGHQLELIENGIMPAGDHIATWNAKGFKPGLYILQLRVNDSFISRKIIINP